MSGTKAPKETATRRKFDTDEVLESAMRVFWKQGYRGASMAALLGATGLSAPSLYAAFGNKERLFKAAVTRYAATRGAILYASLDDPALKAREAFALMFAANVKHLGAARSPAGCLVTFGALHAEGDDAEVFNFLRDIRRSREKKLRARLALALAAEELPAGTDIARLAGYFHTVLLGMRLRSLDGAGQAELSAVAEDAMKSWPEPTAKRR